MGEEEVMDFFQFSTINNGGIDPSSPLGLFIIFLGLVFTIGMPILLIVKGRKD